MRVRIALYCLACAFLACGKSERRGDVLQHGVAGNAASGASHGGAAAVSGASGIGPGGSEDGAAAVSGTAGSIPAASGGGAGGRQVSGGSGATAGGEGGDAGSGASSNEGGSSGDADPPNAGAAGAATLACAGEYVACGCGCCGGTTSDAVCYYPDRGDSLAAIEYDDQAVAASPSCDGAGCALGRHYVCCATPSEPPPAMSYAVTGGMITSDIYRISLYRTGSDGRCQIAHFARGDGPGGKDFPITLPDGWILELLEDFLCTDANSQAGGKRREAVGALGQLDFSSTSGECSVKFDFAAFFASDSGGTDAVEFTSDWQSSPVVPECG